MRRCCPWLVLVMLRLSLVLGFLTFSLPASANGKSALKPHRARIQKRVVTDIGPPLPPDLWVRIRAHLSIPRPRQPELSSVAFAFPAVPAKSPEPVMLPAAHRADAEGAEIRAVNPGDSTAAERSASTDADAIHAIEQYQRDELAYSRLMAEVEAYRQRMDSIQSAVSRATPLLFLIAEELARLHVPLDLVLLPIVESSYRPLALSVKSAAGLWQFMPGTADDYGLVMSDWFDGRLDIVASTQAAARHLARLGDRFGGDWLLALAAYNCGEGCVARAIRANREANLPADFWSLKLPAETLRYVPKLLALSVMFAHPADYGLQLSPIPDRPELVRVRLERPLPVDVLAKLAGMDGGDFRHLNPPFVAGTVALGGPSVLLVPIASVDGLKGRLWVEDLVERARQTLDWLSVDPGFPSGRRVLAEVFSDAD